MLRHHISLFGLSLTVFLLTMALSSCASHHTAATLNDVETYIQTRPDSALDTIRAIDTTTLTTRSLRAHYALLHAMALDKNWIDTTYVGVVMPAVEYYDRHGSADQKMKAYYYLGRIQENQHNYTAAILSFTIAEDASAGSIDEQFKGLLYMGIANVYREVHSVDKALEYTEKAREYFLISGDNYHFDLSAGRLAMAFQEKQDWYKADSLYQLCLQKLKQDTAYMQIYLSQYAVMKVIQPELDPEGAINLLSIISSEYGKPLSMRDYGVYAYASALRGDDGTCEKVLSMMSRQPENRRVQARYMTYRIAEHKGDYKQALDLLKGIYRQQDTTVYEMLDNSVAQTLQEYYEKQASETQRRLVNHRLIWGFVVFCLLVMLGLVAYLLNRKRVRERQAADELVRTAEQANRILQQTNASLESDISVLQKTFAQFYQDQLERIGSLCEAYLKAKSREDEGKKEAVYRRVEKIVNEISRDDEKYSRFEYQVNQYLDNVVDHLKSDLGKNGKVSDVDARFICYTVVGFDTNTISMLLGISPANVYTRRSRLKDRIRGLESPYKDQYQMYISL